MRLATLPIKNLGERKSLKSEPEIMEQASLLHKNMGEGNTLNSKSGWGALELTQLHKLFKSSFKNELKMIL